MERNIQRLMHIFKSLRFRMLAAIVGIVLISTAALQFFVQYHYRQALTQVYYDNAENSVNSMMQCVATEYESILFHREELMMSRKEELKNMSALVRAVIRAHYQRYEFSGEMPDAEEVQQLLEEIRSIRFDDGVGYFWINDVTRPIPRMVMHPIYPELEGLVLDDALSDQLLGAPLEFFQRAVDIGLAAGDGYLAYRWTRPGAGAPRELYAKISYVMYFEPLSWIIGTGVYTDDIEQGVQRRIDAVLRELKQSFSRVQLGQAGYMFLFSGDQDVLIHPTLEHYVPEGDRGEGMRGVMLEMMAQAKEGDGWLDYSWGEASGTAGNMRKKSTYVTYYEPLDWYIGASFYYDEIAASALQLGRQIFVLSGGLLLLAVLVSLVLSRSLTKPLHELAKAVELIEHTGQCDRIMPVSGSIETRKLGTILNNMLASIRKSELQLRTSEMNLLTTLNCIGDAVIATDAAGCVMRMNPVAERLTGCSFQAVCGKPVSEVFTLIYEHTRERIPDPMATVLKTGQACTISEEALLVACDGSEYHIADSVAPIRQPGGPVQGAVLVFRDETEKKLKDVQLIQAQKMEAVGMLAGGLTHDFNNVLTGILGPISIMESMVESNTSLPTEQLLKYLTIMRRSSERAMNMGKQLLSISHCTSVTCVPVDLNQALKHVVELATSTLDRSITIIPDYYDRPALCQADPTQIEQVLLNSFINASHAMTLMRESTASWGGELRAAITVLNADDPVFIRNKKLTSDSYWLISITDTGIGIKKENMEHIFDPFFTTKKKGVGTGLGLSMVHNIIRLHGGFVDVSSEWGVGTIVRIALPMFAPGGSVPKTAVLQGEIPRGSGLILIVDDDELLRLTAKDMLEKCGYRVLVAVDGQDAVEQFKAHSSDIQAVLLDIMMPRMGGKDTYIALKQIKPDVLVVLSSGLDKDSRIQDVLDLGAYSFIQKPYRLEQLGRLMARLTDRDQVSD